MRMQVILDSLFARPGSAPIGGGKKGEFRDWTKECPNRGLWAVFKTIHYAAPAGVLAPTGIKMRAYNAS